MRKSLAPSAPQRPRAGSGGGSGELRGTSSFDGTYMVSFFFYTQSYLGSLHFNISNQSLRFNTCEIDIILNFPLIDNVAISADVFFVGETVEAPFRGKGSYSGKVIKDNKDGTYHIKFADGDEDFAGSRIFFSY